MKLAALMTVYNEAKFLEPALASVYDHIDDIIIVEGAYQETIRMGKPAHSDDGTLEKVIEHHKVKSMYFHDSYVDCSGRCCVQSDDSKIHVIVANAESDAQQRNIGLEKAKELGADWLLIVDGDEVYKPYMFKMIHKAMESNIDAYVFSCLTFVNDFKHYCKQQFPRLFKLHPDTHFTNDNFVSSHGRDWPELKHGIMDIQYYHYAFMKGLERFEAKKEWWESRFDEPFHYDWFIENDKIVPESHNIFEYDGSHPKEIIEKFNV